MSRSIIYCNNRTVQAIIDGGVVSFGSIIRRYGCNLGAEGGNVIVRGSGYYKVDTNITIAATGDISVSVRKDGQIITGATAEFTGLAGTSYAITIPTVFRQICDCESVITVEIAGAISSVTNASIIVEKL